MAFRILNLDLVTYTELDSLEEAKTLLAQRKQEYESLNQFNEESAKNSICRDNIVNHLDKSYVAHKFLAEKLYKPACATYEEYVQKYKEGTLDNILRMEYAETLYRLNSQKTSLMFIGVNEQLETGPDESKKIISTVLIEVLDNVVVSWEEDFHGYDSDGKSNPILRYNLESGQVTHRIDDNDPNVNIVYDLNNKIIAHAYRNSELSNDKLHLLENFQYKDKIVYWVDNVLDDDLVGYKEDFIVEQYVSDTLLTQLRQDHNSNLELALQKFQIINVATAPDDTLFMDTINLE